MTFRMLAKTRRALICVFIFSMSGIAQAQSSDLVSMLTQQLGVSESQASGGLGALLSSAQQNMSTEDFASLGGVIPDMSSLLAAAPEISDKGGDNSGEGSLMSMAGGLLGEQGEQLQYLSGAFDSLGLDSKMIAQYSKLLLQFVESEGGQALKKSLQAALTGG